MVDVWLFHKNWKCKPQSKPMGQEPGQVTKTLERKKPIPKTLPEPTPLENKSIISESDSKVRVTK